MRPFIAVVLSVFALGCGLPEGAALEDEELGTAEQELYGSPTGTYYKVRQDFRRCVSPFCGGFWVSLVNATKTRCVDGTKQSECYVAEIDFANLGLTTTDIQAVAQTALYRAALTRKTYPEGDFGALVPTEAWVAVGQNSPTGTFRRLQDNGLVCLTTPCASITGDRLNNTDSQTFTDLNFTPAYVPDTAVQTARDTIANDQAGILSAGVIKKQGNKVTFEVNQFYFRAQ
jgi:hypothetical protein